MPLIILMIFVLYSVVLGWAWNNLGDTDKIKKILIIVVEIVLVYVITLIVFSISKNGIEYTNRDVEGNIRNIIVALFTGFNSLIAIPFLNKQIIKLKEKGKEEKRIIKRIGVILIIFLICIIFECGYMKDTQRGILHIQKSHSYNQFSSKVQINFQTKK